MVGNGWCFIGRCAEVMGLWMGMLWLPSVRCACVWFVYGSCMVRVWFVYGSCMVRVWFVYGSLMVRVTVDSLTSNTLELRKA